MAHILRKYTSNRGSALFMVISTMTALIISCMAMYFTMVSARGSQRAVFGQMQATQTAQSVLDIASKALNPNNNALNPEFKDKLLALEPGESITTNENGFIVLDPNSTDPTLVKSPAEIGAYSVTITCIEKSGTVDAGDLFMKFDYLVMSTFSGSRDALHFTQVYSQKIEGTPLSGGNGSGGDAQLFAATGYVPNDAYISGGYYVTDVFYDTQYTYMDVYNTTGENRIAQDLYTGGSMLLGSGAMSVVKSHSTAAISNDDVNKIGPVTWAIRGNFYPHYNSDFDMRGGSRILVGGTYENGAGSESLFKVNNEGYEGETDDHICIYVNGDFNHCNTYIKENVWVFVNGKITGVTSLNSNSRLFATSRADTSEVPSGVTIEEWPDSVEDSDEFEYGLTYEGAIKKLEEKTKTIEYYKWDLNDETKNGQHIDIKLNGTNSPWEGLDAYQSTYIISYDNNTMSAPLLEQNGGNELGVVGKSFIIDSVNTNTDYNSCGQTILIDTGDDPNNIINIKVSDITGNGEFGWFASMEGQTEVWWPEHKVIPAGYRVQSGAINNNMRSVLVVGRGTVLINVPNGITYTDAGNGMTGHIGWWMLMGGEVTEINGHINFKGPKADAQISPTIVEHVHRACEPDDGCDFEYNEITDDEAEKCDECGGNLTQVSCPIHGDVNKFCDDCYEDVADRTDWCKNRVDNLKFEESYEDFSSTNQDWVTDDEGKIIYPTTNFMLVSCDESAEMRFAKSKNGTSIDHNHFFGFIYAPYMTYLNAGGSSGSHTVKLCGGMTVGDYDLQAIDEFIGCYPDHMPNELAKMENGGNIAGGALKGTTKTWKIENLGYN